MWSGISVSGQKLGQLSTHIHGLQSALAKASLVSVFPAEPALH